MQISSYISACSFRRPFSMPSKGHFSLLFLWARASHPHDDYMASSVLHLWLIAFFLSSIGEGAVNCLRKIEWKPPRRRITSSPPHGGAKARKYGEEKTPMPLLLYQKVERCRVDSTRLSRVDFERDFFTLSFNLGWASLRALHSIWRFFSWLFFLISIRIWNIGVNLVIGIMRC